jgi:hypothetical protein
LQAAAAPPACSSLPGRPSEPPHQPAYDQIGAAVTA